MTKNMEKMPEPLKNIDWSALVKICADHIKEIDEGREDEDTGHYIYETAMEAIYGKYIWSWINSREE